MEKENIQYEEGKVVVWLKENLSYDFGKDFLEQMGYSILGNSNPYIVQTEIGKEIETVKDFMRYDKFVKDVYRRKKRDLSKYVIPDSEWEKATNKIKRILKENKKLDWNPKGFRDDYCSSIN